LAHLARIGAELYIVIYKIILPPELSVASSFFFKLIKMNIKQNTALRAQGRSLTTGVSNNILVSWAQDTKLLETPSSLCRNA
jgi:hypothetical protein